ncbi:unnamed protein product [Pararhodospirillum photometricum DSM 122]|uniref:Uncharacterized protein n=1 Tax=Pararhodospirillum photometricum DSM 122 TaxID=1150469 RepID=H6SRH8_PARPM|nr:unnamed protein product [Pararhodospirillum photometricum DSM 122]
MPLQDQSTLGESNNSLLKQKEKILQFLDDAELLRFPRGHAGWS